MTLRANGERIGMFRIPTRAHPVLGIERNGSIEVFGYFRSVADADEFMYELALAVGADENSARKDGKIIYENH